MATSGGWVPILRKRVGVQGHLEEEDFRLEGPFLSLADKTGRKLGIEPWPHGLGYPLRDPIQGPVWSDIQESVFWPEDLLGTEAILGSHHWQNGARTWSTSC